MTSSEQSPAVEPSIPESGVKIPDLDESKVPSNPFSLFSTWHAFGVANSTLEQKYSMCLSTCDPATLRPSSRMVILKRPIPDETHTEFVFATNHTSKKGSELLANPQAALLFYWSDLARQIRVEGKVTLLDDSASDSIHNARPYESQLAAAASDQSSEIPSRAAYHEKVEELRAAHPTSVPRPAHWGGFVLKPTYFEFWQGSNFRMHDRVVYSLTQAGTWVVKRLAP